MKAKVKPGDLPETYLPPTKPVRVPADPHHATFAETIQREKEKKKKAEEAWQGRFKKRNRGADHE